MSTQLWWPSCLTSFSCTKSCWKFCGHLRSSPDLGTPGDRPSGVPWSLAQQGMKPMSIYSTALYYGFMITFNIDLSTRFINILQLESVHTLPAKGGSMILRTNEWHALFHRFYTLYIFLRINMDPQVFHHIVFNTNDSQRTLSKCWNALYSGNKSTRFMIFIDVWICLSVYTGKSNKGQLTPGMSGTWPWSDLPGFLASQMYVCIPQSSASKLVSALGPLREGNCWFWSVR